MRTHVSKYKNMRTHVSKYKNMRTHVSKYKKCWPTRSLNGLSTFGENKTERNWNFSKKHVDTWAGSFFCYIRIDKKKIL